MKRPNFFIVGAPKCGTTALSRYLGEHPQVFMCDPKEPCYFVGPKRMRAVPTLDDYLELFWAADARHVAVGEGSVWYLYFTEALREIRAFDPDARIIVMVRNPIELVQAMHSQSIRGGVEDERDFARAWRLQADRASGLRVPPGCPDRRVLLYAEIGKLGRQIGDLLEVFPPAQVRVVLFDDFVRDTHGTYADTLHFLGAEPDGRASFPRVNPNKRARSRTAARILRRWNRRWEPVARRAKRALGVTREVGIRAKIFSLNAAVEERPSIDAAMRAELIETFRADVAQLSDLVGRDLSGWLGEPGAARASDSASSVQRAS